ncbi:Mrp family chromosome partitioning ATPase [Nocardiopsis mwathae]|uniref:Mrp family chromosome partitioning ATPase n=1 Tax=Nocardiopsis mwathae TaxID=1472723 RepID=A0A7W9YMX9_9ACTN|nr:hypothetical protein [Nocardiopsis mwathae]MBB6174944.1 Mrp family chromosome partitioning ATPase [Nocardiopsis mwathae]
MNSRTIAVFSLGGAPGVTTLAVALAAVWPTAASTVMVEADSSGGDIAAWRRMPTSPGLLELAATARSGSTSVGTERGDELLHCTQTLSGGQRVCLAPATADRVAGALTLLAQNPSVLLPAGDSVSVLDLGRLTPRSPAAHLAAFADVALLVVEDDLAQLKRARDTIEALRTGVQRLGLVVTGGADGSEQIAAALGAPVWARIPTDTPAAKFLRGAASPARPHRRPLLTAVRLLASGIATADSTGHDVAPASAS